MKRHNLWNNRNQTLFNKLLENQGLKRPTVQEVAKEISVHTEPAPGADEFGGGDYDVVNIPLAVAQDLRAAVYANLESIQALMDWNAKRWQKMGQAGMPGSKSSGLFRPMNDTTEKELFADIKNIQYFSGEMGEASPRSLRTDGVEFYFANGDVGTIKWEDMGISIK